MNSLLNQRVEMRDGENGSAAHCRGCGHVLGPAGVPWKAAASLRERPLSGLGDVYTTNKDLLLREFACPQCASLLDTEIALPGDPFLNDNVGG